MLDSKFVEMLRCPIEGAKLGLADQELVARINEAIVGGEIRDHQDQKVCDPIDGGLVDEAALAAGQKTLLYPIRGGIPSLVAEQAIVVEAGIEPTDHTASKE